MKIAIAAEASDVNAQIAMHGARAPCYLLFDEQGELLESLANPFAQVERGVGPQVAQFLADKGVHLLAAGDFGAKFLSELEERNIDHVEKAGRIADAVTELIG